ncbi:lipoprotein-releasing ABC transporter permease subunit [Coralliovum pocilloporae]|uniref:lipoprotein-releasing ABC transporter permease subunit n=1 Tax=Coralliovum pocilloporae TaxID=3066369 RepID=UPI003307A06B
MSEPTGTRPFSSFEWMIALRYLRPRNKEAFISIIAGLSFLGITLGVATLIIVMSVMNGFRAELLGKILGINGHLIIQPIDEPLRDFDGLASRVEKLDFVNAAIPFVEGQALASGKNVGSGVLVRGMTRASLDKMSLVSGNIRQGTLEGFDDSGGVAIGTRLAAQLGLFAGSRITLVSPKGAVTPLGVAPRIKNYEVVAIFEIGMSEYDSSFVFMPLPEAQAYFNSPDQVTAIDLYVDDPDQVKEYRQPVEDAADRSLFLVDWQQRNRTFFSALQVERNVMFIILTLIILVAALNIISSLVMLVKDKGHDIAILRTMGATRGAVMRVFCISGAMIGVVGTVAGFVLGVVFCLNIETIRQAVSSLLATDLFSPEIYFLSQLPAKIDMTETFAILCMALVLSLLATIYPAWRAARLDPVQALRYE